MVFNVTFNNISVISWRSVLLVEETRETNDLLQVTDIFNTMLRQVHLVMSGIRTHNVCGDRNLLNTITLTLYTRKQFIKDRVNDDSTVMYI